MSCRVLVPPLVAFVNGYLRLLINIFYLNYPFRFVNASWSKKSPCYFFYTVLHVILFQHCSEIISKMRWPSCIFKNKYTIRNKGITDVVTPWSPYPFAEVSFTYDLIVVTSCPAVAWFLLRRP